MIYGQIPQAMRDAGAKWQGDRLQPVSIRFNSQRRLFKSNDAAELSVISPAGDRWGGHMADCRVVRGYVVRLAKRETMGLCYNRNLAAVQKQLP